MLRSNGPPFLFISVSGFLAGLHLLGRFKGADCEGSGAEGVSDASGSTGEIWDGVPLMSCGVGDDGAGACRLGGLLGVPRIGLLMGEFPRTMLKRVELLAPRMTSVGSGAVPKAL